MLGMIRERLAARRQKPLSRTAQMRRTLGQVLLVAMLVIGGIYYIGTLIIGRSIFQPSSAGAVLAAAKPSSNYIWSSEATNLLPLSGGKQRLDSYRTVVLDLGENKFQATTDGVFSEPTIFSSDGKVSVYLTASDRAAGKSWQLLNNACHGAPAVPASLLQMPPPSEIAADHPHLVSSSATFDGGSAWQISFTPTAQLIGELLWLPFFDKATPSLSGWALSNEDRQALRSGHFTVKSADALVTQALPRTLSEIEVVVDLPFSGEWHLLASVSTSTQGNPLSNLSFGKPAC